MNRTFRVAVVAATLAAAAPAAAQRTPEARVGLGVGLPTNELAQQFGSNVISGGLIAPQLYVPINVTPNLRIEPQIGILTFHNDDTGDRLSYWSIGTGVFFLMPLGGNVDMYVGPRIALSFFNQRTVGGGGVVTKDSATDVFVAAALGGEYHVHPRLSVGAEGQIGYTSIGDLDRTTNGVTETIPGGSTWSTQGVIFVRVYFL